MDRILIGILKYTLRLKELKFEIFTLSSRISRKSLVIDFEYFSCLCKVVWLSPSWCYKVQILLPNNSICYLQMNKNLFHLLSYNDTYFLLHWTALTTISHTSKTVLYLLIFLKMSEEENLYLALSHICLP